MTAPGPAGRSTSLTEQTSRGVFWGVGGALTYQLYALMAQTVLTYLLSKSQYGSYGKALALVSFSMLLQQTGFNEVLLRRPRRLKLWSAQVAWFALGVGFAGTLLLAIAAYPAALLYHDPRLTGLVLLSAPLPIIRSLAVVPTLQLIESMRFRWYFGLITLNALVALSLTLLLAFFGFEERSFILGTLIAEPVFIAILWRTAGTRICSGPRPASWAVLAGKLKFVLGANVARWARMSIDPLILGLFASPSAVGIYFYAQSMASQIVRLVTLNLSGVLLPALNKIENDPVRQTDAFLRACRVLGLVGVPMCVGLGAVAELFVRVFLDQKKWQALPPVLSAMALGMVFRMLDEPTQSLLSAQGRFRLGFRISVSAGVLYALICTVGSLRGDPFETAIAIAAYNVFAGPVVLTIAIRGGGGKIWDPLKVFLIPLSLSIVAIGPWLLLDRLLPGTGRARDAAVLFSVMFGSMFSYFLLGRWFEPSGWRELITKLQSVVPTPLAFLAKPLHAALRKI
jgi:O-antigen/teichoic acid export membrane protein